MRVFLTLRRLIFSYRWMYVGGVAALLLADLAQLILPQLLKNFVNLVQSAGTAQASLLPLSLAIASVGVATFLFRMLWRLSISGASRHIDYVLRSDLFKKLTDLSAPYFDRKKTGDLMAHATNDLRAVRMATSMGVILTVDTLFLITSTIFIMARTISPRLTLLAVIPLFLMALSAWRMGGTIHRRNRQVQNAFSDLSDLIQENLSGIRVVKGFVQEEAELQNLTAANRAYVQRNMELVRVWGLFDPLVDLISGLSFVVALSYGGIQVIDGTLSLGSLVAFISYLVLLTGPMEATGWLMNLLQRGAASMERLQDIYQAPVDITESPGAKRPQGLAGHLRVRSLTFTYPSSDRPALSDVSFDLPAGQTLGLIGRTGSGKSTLLQLLLRIYDPPAGTIFIDGHDVRELSFSALRSPIGYVPGDTFLFSDTIGDNIAFGADDIGLEAVLSSAEVARVKEDIDEFPDEFDTVLGERGITLSGGQKQRVALARALAKNPSILLLDDALSAVDTRTEDGILNGLKKARQDRTTVIVAHRISTIQHADLILVLEHGRVVERGCHEDLLAHAGLYAALYEKQLLQEKIDGTEEMGA